MWGFQHPSICEARGRGAAQNLVEVGWAGYMVGSGVVLWALGWSVSNHIMTSTPPDQAPFSHIFHPGH